jgi:hypothetical protein
MRWRRALTVAAVVTAFVVLGVRLVASVMPQGVAEKEASRAALATADSVRAHFESALDQGPHPIDEGVVASAISVVAGPNDGNFSVPKSMGNGDVQWNATFYGNGHGGGGLWYSSITVRLCVSFNLAHDSASLVMSDASCVDETRNNWRHGSVDETIELGT